MSTAKQMDMVPVATDGFHFYSISLLDRFGCFHYDLSDLFIQKAFPVFYWKNNMIMYLPDTMIASFYGKTGTFRHEPMIPRHFDPVASCGELHFPRRKKYGYPRPVHRRCAMQIRRGCRVDLSGPAGWRYSQTRTCRASRKVL